MGKIFLISGLSGSGKSFLTDLVLRELPWVNRVVTCTTRLPREGELDGVNYFYFSLGEFAEKRKKGLFAEWAFVYENYYGTLRSSIDDSLLKYRASILVVDVKGARELKTKYKNATSIFIDVENLEVAKKRITARGHYPDDLLRRTTKGAEELVAAASFDHRVMNVEGRPEITVRSICEIIVSNVSNL